MRNLHAFDPEYGKKLIETRDKCKSILTDKGLFVEDTFDEIGLSISLTQFGLSTVYATLTQQELEYIIDNDVEL